MLCFRGLITRKILFNCYEIPSSSFCCYTVVLLHKMYRLNVVYLLLKDIEPQGYIEQGFIFNPERPIFKKPFITGEGGGAKKPYSSAGI